MSEFSNGATKVSRCNLIYVNRSVKCREMKRTIFLGGISMEISSIIERCEIKLDCSLKG